MSVNLKLPGMAKEAREVLGGQTYQRSEGILTVVGC